MDVEMPYILVLRLARRQWTQCRAAEERHFDVFRKGVHAEKPALSVEAVERRVPLNGLLNTRNLLLDDRVESMRNVTFPPWKRGDVRLDRRITFSLRDLRVAA